MHVEEEEKATPDRVQQIRDLLMDEVRCGDPEGLDEIEEALTELLGEDWEIAADLAEDIDFFISARSNAATWFASIVGRHFEGMDHSQRLEVIRRLRRLRRESGPVIRHGLLTGFESVGDRRGLEFCLEDGNPKIQRAAQEALEELDREEAGNAPDRRVKALCRGLWLTTAALSVLCVSCFVVSVLGWGFAEAGWGDYCDAVGVAITSWVVGFFACMLGMLVMIAANVVEVYYMRVYPDAYWKERLK